MDADVVPRPKPQKGKNRLCDGMEQAIEVAKGSRRELRSVVVFSDGERATDDTFTMEHVVTAAHGDAVASVPVHSLAWDKGQASAQNQAAIEDLRKVALGTGGMRSRVSGADLDPTLDGWFALLAVHAAGGVRRPDTAAGPGWGLRQVRCVSRGAVRSDPQRRGAGPDGRRALDRALTSGARESGSSSGACT